MTTKKRTRWNSTIAIKSPRTTRTAKKKVAKRKKSGSVAVRKRKRAEKRFARNFHSEERVRWVKGFACVFCDGWDDVRNAHMTSRGAGGDWRKILPVCAGCDAKWERGRLTFLKSLGMTWADVEKMLEGFNSLWEQDSQLMEDTP